MPRRRSIDRAARASIRTSNPSSTGGGAIGPGERRDGRCRHVFSKVFRSLCAAVRRNPAAFRSHRVSASHITSRCRGNASASPLCPIDAPRAPRDVARLPVAAPPTPLAGTPYPTRRSPISMTRPRRSDRVSRSCRGLPRGSNPTHRHRDPSHRDRDRRTGPPSVVPGLPMHDTAPPRHIIAGPIRERRSRASAGEFDRSAGSSEGCSRNRERALGSVFLLPRGSDAGDAPCEHAERSSEPPDRGFDSLDDDLNPFKALSGALFAALDRISLNPAAARRSLKRNYSPRSSSTTGPHDASSNCRGPFDRHVRR